MTEGAGDSPGGAAPTPPGFELESPDVGAVPGPRIRLLNGEEYRATIADLLGVDASPAVAHFERGSGYTTGAEGKIDENLFATFLIEAERLAQAYVAGPIGDDYACFRREEITDDCMSELIADLGLRAYRRPLSDEEATGLLVLFRDIAETTSDRVLAAESLVARLLSSIHFLHRTEIGARNGDHSFLTPYERASLLSFAVIGSTPDDELLRAAAEDTLDESGIRFQVQRLLATPRGQDRLEGFLRQWLRVEVLADMASDPESFPKLETPEQGAGLEREFRAYVESTVFDGPGTLQSFLTSDYTFVNQHTASLYGADQSGNQMNRLAFDEPRRGVLGLASVMAAHASVGDPDKDRPVIRGLLIKNQFVCEEVGLPAGINTADAAMMVTDDLDEFDTLTTREQFEAIMNQDQQCQDCHVQFMPFGFLFGHFDALGRFRTEKGPRNIDTNVDSVVMNNEARAFTDHLALIDELSSSDVVAQCFARHLSAYIVGTAEVDIIDGLSATLQANEQDHQGEIQLQLETLFASPRMYERSWDEALLADSEAP
ncbi:MAG: DUF1592 domain-containing protein [Myxococcota bacterium]